METSTRVDRLVSLFHQSNETLHEELGDVYQHYLDKVDAINDGSFDIDSIPHFTEAAQPVIHGGVMFGITWGKESTVSVVTTSDGTFVSTYGVRENAERAVDADTHKIQQVTPKGRGVEDEITSMRNADTALLQELGEAIEYLHNMYSEESTDSIESVDHDAMLSDVPNLDEETSTVLLYSILFGRQWEYSDPGLWVVTIDGEFDSLHGSNQSVTKREAQLDSCTVEAVTPVDNDRQAFTIDNNTLLTD
jgi:hypothetical protein